MIYDVAIQVVFFLVVIVCAITELRENRVYNVVTYPAILLGLGLNYLDASVPGAKLSLFGGLVGFGVYLLFYMMKGIGAGDVKLAAAFGTLKGFPFIGDVIVWTALFGGAMAIFVAGFFAAKELFTGAAREIRALRKAGSAPPANEEKEKQRMPHIPYGVAMCMGAVVTFLCRKPVGMDRYIWINITW